MTPRHDPSPSSGRGARRAAFGDAPRRNPALSEPGFRGALTADVLRAIERLLAASRRPKGKPGAADEACPVEPNRPLNLSGGAAAALEFDD